MAETAATQMEKRVARLLTADWVQGGRKGSSRGRPPPRPAPPCCAPVPPGVAAAS